MELIVQKYGGTSVATADLIMSVAKRIKKIKKEKKADIAVVVSAMGKTTDELVSRAKKINENPSMREMDMLLSCGETMSIALLTMALHKIGVDAISLTGAQVGIVTDTRHTEAKIIHIDTSRIKKHLKEGKVVIVAGFQGVSQENEITTLGRGGSDTSAVALAAALSADVCEILTDVDGVYSADPNTVTEARKIKRCSYDAVLEMAFMGAKVLHPRSVEIARKHKLPLHVRSSFNDEEGTIIEEIKDMDIEKNIVRGIAHNKNIVKVSIVGVPDQPGVAAKIFKGLDEKNIRIGLIVQAPSHDNRTDITFVANSKDIDIVKETVDLIVEKIGAKEAVYNEDVATISIVWEGISGSSQISAKIFEVLAKKKINIDVISTSTITITCIIEKDKLKEAVKALHEELIEKEL
ncbi:MAG: aspartate kinase [Armatimonadota bacterium]